MRPRVRDRDLNPDWIDLPAPLRPAAVLAPIVRRPEGWTMLFTQRAHETPAHPGQVSFPGGRVHADDASPLETALRETEEEIGLARRFIEPIGAWDRYNTGTGFTVTPILGLVEPGFELTLDPREVAEVFETPLVVPDGPRQSPAPRRRVERRHPRLLRHAPRRPPHLGRDRGHDPGAVGAACMGLTRYA